jgi:hypothetical protein
MSTSDLAVIDLDTTNTLEASTTATRDFAVKYCTAIKLAELDNLSSSLAYTTCISLSAKPAELIKYTDSESESLSESSSPAELDKPRESDK